MMRLIDDDPVWTSGFRAALQEAWEQGGEKRRPLSNRQGEKIYDYTSLRSFQRSHHDFQRRALCSSPQGEDSCKMIVIALGIDQAELIFPLRELFEDSRDRRRFAAARQAG